MSLNSPPPLVFLLSPAHLGGKRAELLARAGADFELARRLQSGGRATLAEVYSFVSGLYFRGKLTYAQTFARPSSDGTRLLVISNNRGLLGADTLLSAEDLREIGTVDIHAEDSRFREPLLRDATNLLGRLGNEGKVVLLGSIATGKYVDVLLEVFGERLLFPASFVGRGDLSRGGLCLRAAGEGKELIYEVVARAVRKGKRPAKLGPKTY